MSVCKLIVILFVCCECLLVVHLLTSLVNSIHRNLLCQVAKLLSVVQHTVAVRVVGLVRVVVGRLVVTVVVGRLVVTVVGLVRVVVGRLVVAVVALVRVVVALVRVVVALVRVVVGLVAVVVGRLVVALVVTIVVGRLVVAPGSHAILITGIFEGVVQRRRSVEIIISLVGVCLIIHLVY